MIFNAVSCPVLSWSCLSGAMHVFVFVFKAHSCVFYLSTMSLEAISW
jgi:hypothetical protein